MIELNRNHPDFCEMKEVMCLLPKLPCGSELDTMAEDLGITRDSLGVYLKKIGYRHRLTMHPGDGDMAVGVSRLSWATLKEDADHYFNTVYGDTTNGI